MPSRDEIFACDLDDLPARLANTTPGSTIDNIQWQGLSIKLTHELVQALRSAAVEMSRSTDALSEEVRLVTAQSKATGQQLLRLNVVLVWLTVLLAVMTAVLVVFGIAQL